MFGRIGVQVRAGNLRSSLFDFGVKVWQFESKASGLRVKVLRFGFQVQGQEFKV